MRFIIFSIVLVLLGISSKYAWDIHHLQKEQSELKEQLASINRINYGLFNIQLWKEKAIDIFEERIENFKIDPQVYKEVQGQLNNYLIQIYKDYFESGRIVDEFVSQQEKDGKKINTFLLKMVKDNIGETLKSFDIKSKIPGISKQLLDELRKNEPQLKGYLKKELNQLIFENNPAIYTDPREAVYKYYNTTSLEECNAYLQSKISDNQIIMDGQVQIIYILLLVALMLAALFYKLSGLKLTILAFTLISIMMLILGVSLPMIDIDARLNQINMIIFDNNISFDEQYLYYQSKSILDVTWTLLEGRGVDLKIVGLLILMFSIVFPFFKLVLSTLFLYFNKLQQSKLAQNIIFYLGKWSMADVFVVAMFMAYIGFDGLVTSQLDQISGNSSGFAVETLNYSALAPGALFFVSYCVLSIVVSIIINKNYKELH